MGKQGRRKQRQKRNQRRQQVQNDPIHNNNTTPVMNNDGSTTLVASTSIANPHSAVQQLRNPDPKVRHAALVALQASVLSQLTSSSRPINIEVLQAVREQVTNNDLECSAVAADCLAQYLSATADNTNNSKNKDVTASWSVVLIGRLNDCYQALLAASQEEEGATKVHLSKNQQKKREKVKKQWYAVTAPCLIALCHLIEDNAGNALDRINTEKKTFVEIIFGLLSLQCVTTTATVTKAMAPTDDEMMTDSAATAASATDTQQQLMSDKIANELRETTALYAARCLHSSLDDNQELAEVLQQHGDTTRPIWKTFLGGSSDTHALTMTTRLHLLGCVVNLYQLSYDPSSKEQQQQSSSWQEELLLEYGINTDDTSSPSSSSSSASGLLWKALFLGSDQKNDWRQQERKWHGKNAENFHVLSMELTKLEMQYRHAQELLATQEQDQQLEDEIDAKVRERKEPAKDIAKRQKKEKEQYKNQQQQQNQEMMTTESEAKIATTVTATAIGDDTEVDDIDMMDVAPPPQQRHSGKIIREQNGEEAVNDALGKWNEQMGQVQLALEIVTNLLSTWVTTNNSNDEDDDMNNSNDNESNTLRDVIGKHQTCSQLMILLQTLTSFVRKGTKQKQKNNNNAVPYEQNDVIKLDIDTTISKIAACMMNCLLCENVVIMDDTTTTTIATHTNTSSLAVVEELWSDILYKELLQFCVHDDNRDTNIIRNGNDMIVESLLSILVVLTKVYPDLIIYHTRKCGMIVQRKKIMNVFHSIIMTTKSRDAVCLLSAFVHMEATKVAAATQAVPTSVTIEDEENTCISFLDMENIVRDTTKSFTLLLLLPSTATAAVATTTTTHNNNNNNHHKIEILKTFMDWYGNDTFYPILYNELHVSDAITSCLQSIAASVAALSNNNDSNSSMDMEEEEMMILSNSERFVEYKKQLLLQQQQQQQQ